MKGRVITALLLASAAAGCGSSTTTTIITTASPTTPPSNTGTGTGTGTTSTAQNGQTAGPVLFQGAVGNASQRPTQLLLSADGTLEVVGVQWASWGGAEAAGTGTAQYHGCTPNCAQAPQHTATVAVRLSGIRTCSSGQYYSTVSLTTNAGQQIDQQFLQRSWSPC